MRLSLHEQEKLLVHVAAMVARDRRDRGRLLNHPEAVALISSFVMEGARDGVRVAELAESARHVVTRAEVMEGVADMIPVVQVEATFPDGTKLVSVHRPIS
jgi:urease gamma subunit